MLGLILGLASGVASAAGTIAGGSKTGTEGLSATLQAIARRSQASAVSSNARLSNMFLGYNSMVQQRENTFAGETAKASGDYAGKQLYRKGRSDFAYGLAGMQEAQRDARKVSSTFQSQAAASGFIPTEGDLGTEAGAIEGRGEYIAGMHRYGAEIARNTSFAQGDAARAEGDYAFDSAKWQNTALRGQTKLQMMMNRMTAQRQGAALYAEASGYDVASSAAKSAASRNQTLSFLSAGSTLLGSGAKAYADYKVL